MENNILVLVQFLLHYGLLLAIQLLAILLVRKTIHETCGAVWAYRLWLFPLLWLFFYLPDWAYLWSLVPGSSQALSDLPASATSSPEVSGFAFEALVRGSIENVRNSLFVYVLFWTWLAGAMCFACRFLFCTWRFSRFLAEHSAPCSQSQRESISIISQLPPDVPVLLVDGLPGPALYGAFRPNLLLPCNFFNQYDDDARKVMLAHEAVHFRRRDNVSNAVMVLAQAVFWFNPLIFISYRYYRQDQELACDALVLNDCDARQRKQYAYTLLASTLIEGDLSAGPMLSRWNKLQDIKERAARINTFSFCGTYSSTGRKAFAVLGVAGCVISSAYAATSVVFARSFDAVVVPEELKVLFGEALIREFETAALSRNSVPADSEYLVFIVDTSGSSFNYGWDLVLEEFRVVLSQYPDIRGIQVLSDMGTYLVPESEGEWLQPTASERSRLLEELLEFHPFSNSSPFEGMERALSDFVEPSASVSMFIFGDELTADPATFAETLSFFASARPGLRIHTRMFPIQLFQPEQYRETGYRFAETMLELSGMTQGSFKLAPSGPLIPGSAASHGSLMPSAASPPGPDSR